LRWYFREEFLLCGPQTELAHTSRMLEPLLVLTVVESILQTDVTRHIRNIPFSSRHLVVHVVIEYAMILVGLCCSNVMSGCVFCAVMPDRPRPRRRPEAQPWTIWTSWMIATSTLTVSSTSTS
jgi:hypothetical protein